MENRKYERGTLGWIKEQQRINAKKDGFTNVEDWKKWKTDLLDFYRINNWPTIKNYMQML